MIYTIDRETPAHGLQKATHEELDRIGKMVRDAGIACSVSYWNKKEYPEILGVFLCYNGKFTLEIDGKRTANGVVM